MQPSELRTSPSGELDAGSLLLAVASISDYAIFMLDPAGHVVSWNKGAAAIKGYAAAEIIGSHFSRFYTPEAIARGWPQQELDIASAEGRLEDEGWRLRKDGSRFWANVVITALRGPSGDLVGFCKVTRDLTERKRQENALRESEQRFRSLVEGVTDYAIFMLDPQGFVVSWNSGARQIKGYEAHEIIGSHFSRFYPPDAIQKHWPEHELAVATMEGRFEDQGWRIRKDGSRFWASVVVTALRDERGELTGFSKITRDLTEARIRDEAVRRSEERLRLLVEGVGDYAIFSLDPSGYVSSWNSGAHQITGYAADEVLGRHYSHLYRPEDVAANKPWHDLATARQTDKLCEESLRLRKDGSVFYANVSLTSLRDSDGQLYGFANVTQDLTQKRQVVALEDAARRMHEFVAMLAHELRNPLAPIRNAVSLMGRKGLADPTLEAMRQTIDRQSLHLTRIVDELLDVNRIARGRFSIERRPLDLHDVLVRAIEASRPLLDARGHTFHTSLPEAAVPMIGDAVRLTQAVINLLNNAAKFTEPGGQVSLTASTCGTDVEIRVKDTGRGIEPEQLDRIFGLFVQASPIEHGAQGGLGVGLALVQRVAELHGGTVEARSEGLGAGSEFILRLPLGLEGARIAGPSSGDEGARLPALRILVVDDNKDAADSLALLLQALGQETRTVYDGTAAVAAVQSFRPQIILLDIGMPHMNGYEVARRVVAQPHGGSARLVAVTGWGQDVDKQRSREAGFHQHFVKPVSEEALRSLIAETAESYAGS